MRYRNVPSPPAKLSLRKLLMLLLFVGVSGIPAFVSAQSYKKDLDTGEKVSLTVRSHSGRVSVIAQDEQVKRVTVEATSLGAPVDQLDVRTVAKGNNVDVEVRDRREKDRIDVTVRIPSRSRVKVEGEAGSVDIVGNVESAEVSTNTGTIHADVPLDAVKFDFVWSASKPRYRSEEHT